MAEIDLRFIGERLDRVQAELRDLRGIKADVVQLRSELIQLGSEVARVEVSINERIDHLERSFDARFDQVHQTIATNFAIVFELLKGVSTNTGG